MHSGRTLPQITYTIELTKLKWIKKEELDAIKLCLN